MVVAMVLPFEGDILSHVGRGRERKVSEAEGLTVCQPQISQGEQILLPIPVELDAGVAFYVEADPSDDVATVSADGDVVGDGFFAFDAGDF